MNYIRKPWNNEELKALVEYGFELHETSDLHRGGIRLLKRLDEEFSRLDYTAMVDNEMVLIVPNDFEHFNEQLRQIMVRSVMKQSKLDARLAELGYAIEDQEDGSTLIKKNGQKLYRFYAEEEDLEKILLYLTL